MTVTLEMPFGEYLALPRWGSSSLSAMRRGPPARVMWERANRKEDTDATLLGRLVHCSLLTPDLLDVEYVCKPDGMTFSTKEGKAWRDAQTAQIVAYDAYWTALGIGAAVREKKLAGDTIQGASLREVTLLWDCPISGEACKGRPDWIYGHHVYDLKVSRHADGHALGMRAFIEGWMHQIAHYRTGAQALGIDVRGGRLVVVAPKPPHMVYTLEVKVDSLDLLEHENIATLQAMRECRLADRWPGTPDSWTKIEPPASATSAFEEMSFDTADNEEEQEAVTNG